MLLPVEIRRAYSRDNKMRVSQENVKQQEITKREKCGRQESPENYLVIVKNTVAYIFKQLQQSIRHQPKKAYGTLGCKSGIMQQLKYCIEKKVSVFTEKIRNVQDRAAQYTKYSQEIE